jgi:hypothetical protein
VTVPAGLLVSGSTSPTAAINITSAEITARSDRLLTPRLPPNTVPSLPP